MGSTIFTSQSPRGDKSPREDDKVIIEDGTSEKMEEIEVEEIEDFDTLFADEA